MIVAILVGLAFGLGGVLPVAAPVTCEDYCTAPSLGSLILCENEDGEKVSFEVIDRQNGDNYEVWILQEEGGNDLRVGFDNQVVESTKATSIEVQTKYYDEDRGDWFTRFYTADTEVDSTGQCGKGPYDTKGTVDDPADVVVTVKFSGMTITISEAESETVTHEEWSENTFTWGFSATAEDDGGEVTGEFSGDHTYGESTTTSWEASSSVTWTSSQHTFKQDYQIP